MLGWGHWETGGVGGRACHPLGCPGRSPFPKCASPEAKGPRQSGWGWGQLPPVPCPLAALGRSRREDSPALVITSCPGWEKAPGGEGDGAAAVLVLPAGLEPWGVRVPGPWPCSLVPAPSAPCKQPGLALLGMGSPGQPCPAAVLSNLGSALPFGLRCASPISPRDWMGSWEMT